MVQRQCFQNEEPSEKLSIQEPHNAKRLMKLVLKINEVAKGEGPLSFEVCHMSSRFRRVMN